MEYRIQGKTLKDIADSIRAVDSTIQAMAPQNMDDEIRRLTAVIDQTYDSESSNAIAGKAVKEAIEPLSTTVSQYDEKIEEAKTSANDAEIKAEAASSTAQEALDKISTIGDNVVTQDELAWVELHVD